jgi:3-hydroxyacyl-[acyl-carrier-protein] dehydratase
MQFQLLDRIEEIELGSRIIAVKHLHADEQYLSDHFPNFPVMPGVLMMEAMFQACRWLLLESDDYRRAVVVLREARNVKFTDFVSPGQELKISATIMKDQDSTVTLKVSRSVDGANAVSGRLILERFNLADRYPEKATFDVYGRRELRKTCRGLLPPHEAATAKLN